MLISASRKWLRQFYGHLGLFWFSLLENPHAHKILFLWGGGVWGFLEGGGASANFILMGVGIFPRIFAHIQSSVSRGSNPKTQHRKTNHLQIASELPPNRLRSQTLLQIGCFVPRLGYGWAQGPMSVTGTQTVMTHWLQNRSL